MVRVQGPAEIVIVTGMFGAGWRTAVHTMKDLGWYVVDNLSPAMLPILVDRMGTVERLAVVIDVRSGEKPEQLPTTFAKVRVRDYCVMVLFLGASSDVIVQRQRSNRWSLLLQYGGRLLDGIIRERRPLVDLRASADIVVDTSRLNIRQPTQRVSNHFGTDTTDNLSVALMFFGFKNGLPVDADIVFDVCFLPNLYWVSELRPKTGLSPSVASYVSSQGVTQEFQGRVLGIIEVTVSGCLTEDKR